MASLTFSQTIHEPDPNQPSRVVRNTTTSRFSMTREMAKITSQHFMDARLIENATDLSSNFFKDRGVYQLTPKGLHVLERFITENGINSNHLQPVFSSQPICIRLLHLERRPSDDEIIATQSVITAVFRHFVGRQPNYEPPADKSIDTFQKYNERSKGIALKDITERAQSRAGKLQLLHKHCFRAVAALNWLCDFTTVLGRDEAAEISAHFVRFGLITLVSDKRKKNESTIVFTVRGSEPGSKQGEFRCSEKAIYTITDEGCRLANWDHSRVHGSQHSPSASPELTMSRSSVDSSEDSCLSEKKRATDANTEIYPRISLSEKLDVNNPVERMAIKESNADRLQYILEEPVLLSLFREFLWSNFGNPTFSELSFWLDVQDLKKKFNTTSSIMPALPANKHPEEKHHETLINTALTIYNTYLTPSSDCELHIDPGLKNESVQYLEEVITSLTGKSFQGKVEFDQVNSFSDSQLQTLIHLYDRCQTHVFHLMATDSVPAFIKSRKFLDMRYWVGDFDLTETRNYLQVAGPPGLTDVDAGGVYITISAQESERIHRLLTAVNEEPSSS